MLLVRNIIVCFFVVLLIGYREAVSSSAFQNVSDIQQEFIYCAQVTYFDSDSILVSPGHGVCNGYAWRIESEQIITLKNLDTRGGYYYIYLENNCYDPLPYIVDMVTEPQWDITRKGWYLGNNRCIGVVLCESGAKTIKPFRYDGNDKYIFEQIPLAQVVFESTPSECHETISIKEICPVMTTAIYVEIVAYGKSSGKCVINCLDKTKGQGVHLEKLSVQDHVRSEGWISFENYSSDNELVWYGEGAAQFNIYIKGFQIER